MTNWCFNMELFNDFEIKKLFTGYLINVVKEIYSSHVTSTSFELQMCMNWREAYLPFRACKILLLGE